MQYIHNEYEAHAGDRIEVTIDHAANVQLLDQENYEHYKNGREFRYIGGYATETPVRFNVPRPGRWHVIVDLGGGAGRVRAGSRLLTGAAS